LIEENSEGLCNDHSHTILAKEIEERIKELKEL